MKTAGSRRRHPRGDLRPEYEFDYSRAKPNRFASPIQQRPASGKSAIRTRRRHKNSDQ
jgi:hypothetical protein